METVKERLKRKKAMLLREVQCVNYSLDECVEETAIPLPTNWGRKQKEEEEQKMNTSIQVSASTNETARDYMSRRLDKVYNKKDHELQVKFGMKDSDRPETVSDLVQRIKDGKYTISEDYKDCEVGYYSLHEYIHWRDPAIKRDPAGYKAAKEKLDALRTATKDSIVVMEPTDGLAALQAFEASSVQ